MTNSIPNQADTFDRRRGEGEPVPCGETAFACRRGNPSSGELASVGGFPAVGDCELAVGGFSPLPLIPKGDPEFPTSWGPRAPR